MQSPVCKGFDQFSTAARAPASAKAGATSAMKRAISSLTCACGLRPTLTYRITSEIPAASAFFSVSVMCCGCAEQHRVLGQVFWLHLLQPLDHVDEIPVARRRGTSGRQARRG